MYVINYKKLLSSCTIAASCAVLFNSCDGGGSSSTVSTDVSSLETIQIPIEPNAANSEVTGESADDSGADETLETVFETQILDLINDERTSLGLDALVLDSDLSELAEDHNEGLVDRAIPGGAIEIDHDGAQGRADVAIDDGFVSYGENVAAVRGFGEDEVADTFAEGWINSPGHFENLTGEFTATGIDVTVDETDGTIYATQIFAR